MAYKKSKHRHFYNPKMHYLKEEGYFEWNKRAKNSHKTVVRNESDFTFSVIGETVVKCGLNAISRFEFAANGTQSYGTITIGDYSYISNTEIHPINAKMSISNIMIARSYYNPLLMPTISALVSSTYTKLMITIHI